MLSDTCPDKVEQLINEHENFIKKLGIDWNAQISQAARNLLVIHDASSVPNYAVADALEHANIDLNLIYNPCMKKLVVNKMTSLSAQRQRRGSVSKSKSKRSSVSVTTVYP